MRAQIKAPRTKPSVGIATAIGSIYLQADSPEDVCLLTAIGRMLMNPDQEKALSDALIASADRVAKELQSGPEFTMITRRGKR